MVVITEDQIYDVMSYDWQQGRKIRSNLMEQLGLKNPSLWKKVAYVLTFQSWTVGYVDFYQKISNLKHKGLAEIEDRVEEIEGEKLKIRYARKKSGGVKNKNNRESPVGNLELDLSFG